MKSMTETTPSAVVNSVSRIKVPGWYQRVTRLIVPSGVNNHLPFSGVPSSAAKHAGESNLGKDSQSIEPFRPTSAAVSQSPMSA